MTASLTVAKILFVFVVPLHRDCDSRRTGKCRSRARRESCSPQMGNLTKPCLTECSASTCPSHFNSSLPAKANITRDLIKEDDELLLQPNVRRALGQAGDPDAPDQDAAEAGGEYF